MPSNPFEVPFADVKANPDAFVTSVFSNLVSEFLIMPKGEGFVEYSVFDDGYEKLKQGTSGFQNLSLDMILPITLSHPISIVILRSIMGFSPSEWAYLASQRAGTEISQNFVRSLDRKIRMQPSEALQPSGVVLERLKALIEVACQLLNEGPPGVDANKIHRLEKADTKNGAESLRSIAGLGVPYAILLYERFLGRPFAGHKDSVSELIGDSLELAIERVLDLAGISHRKTKRAERIQGFDQAPDFIVPDEFNPKVVIEAKIAEDDGTARDKVTRIQHLGELSIVGQAEDKPKYEVIACIGGRGFGVRREDMRKMLLATRGKVFTLKTMDRMVDCSALKDYRTK
jgi:hypothetical protein